MASTSTSEALPSKTWLHVPQRTIPPRNFNWSEATRKVVLQWGHLVASAMPLLSACGRYGVVTEASMQGDPTILLGPDAHLNKWGVSYGHFLGLTRQHA